MDNYNRVIMIKYGELTTKKDNRKLFVNALYNNIKLKLKEYNVSIFKDLSRMYIEFNDNDLDNIIKNIGEVFGIHAYDVAYKTSTNIDDIANCVIALAKENNFKTFKVDTKRSDKGYNLTSVEISKLMGGKVLKNKENIKVDVHNPEVTFHIEVRRDYSYIYLNEYKGLGGYPVGTLGKGLLMLSGGIDSPVAGYLAMKRGIKIDCLYFEAIPHTSLEARDKVIKLRDKLLKYGPNIRLFVVPFTEIQESIYKTCEPDYVITIMRRMMYRIAERVINRYKYHVIINGESIGQVASQTLTSMRVINNVTNLPVIRPCACLDKLEIIDISEKIDTYNISILPYEDCCTVFVPKHPVINPNLTKCIEMEKNFDYETMINNAIDNIIKFDVKKDEYEDLF